MLYLLIEVRSLHFSFGEGGRDCSSMFLLLVIGSENTNVTGKQINCPN